MAGDSDPVLGVRVSHLLLFAQHVLATVTLAYIQHVAVARRALIVLSQCQD